MRLLEFLVCAGPPKAKGEDNYFLARTRSTTSAERERDFEGKRQRQRGSSSPSCELPHTGEKVAPAPAEPREKSISLEDVQESDVQAVGHLARAGSRDLKAKCLAPRRRTDTGAWLWTIPAAVEVLDMSGMDSGDQTAYTLDTLLSPRQNQDGTYSFPGSLKKLVLQGTGLTKTGAVCLGNIIRHVTSKEGAQLCNTTLSSLDLQDNYLMDDGVAALAKSLTAPPEAEDNQKPSDHGLRELWLGGNCIGVRGVEALLSVLIHKESTVKLDKLGLGHNQLNDKAAEAIAAALSPIEEKDGSWTFPTIAKCMNLWGNKIADDGAEALAEAIAPMQCLDGSWAVNTTLMSLNIFRNNISEKGKTVLRDAVERLNALRHEDCQLTLLI